MGKLFLYNVCILICWALVLMNTAAEREYFVQDEKVTWNDARNHCQICFKELVTLTPDNIQLIAHRLNSDHWIGLRKNLSSSDNSSVLWSRWANGDPLVFQNWYPGWPVSKPTPPKANGCNCSCTCTANTITKSTNYTSVTEAGTDEMSLFDFPDENVTNFTTIWGSSVRNITSYSNDSYIPSTSTLKIDAACELSQTSVVPETNENDSYIEDSCVAMRSFGPWVEKRCSELLPFICYEDRFFGHVNVTEVTSTNATLSWQPLPDISHYHVEVKDDNGMNTGYNLSSLTDYLVDLTPGGHYKVQVFPVKCGRKLNPQNATFYTEPNKVRHLEVNNVMETSVILSWEKPEGKLNFYLVKNGNEEIKNKTDLDGTQTYLVDGLIPGSLYNFSVLTGVQDKSRWSEESYVTALTKPGKVSSLTVSGNTNNSVQLNWTAPEGSFTGFRVTAVVINVNTVCFSKTVNQEEYGMLVDDLPSGSKISLSVTTLANHTTSPNYRGLAQEGDEKTIVTYTAPGPISNLTVSTDQNSLNASWSGPEGNYSSFNVTLTLEGIPDSEKKETNKTQVRFTGLKNSANYTVAVSAVSGDFEGPPLTVSILTKPSPPTHAEAASSNFSSITFKWEAPEKIATPSYRVKLTSSYWKYNTSESITSTTHTFFNLKSGTKYYFEVSALAGEHESLPASCFGSTEAKKVEISLSMLCTSAKPLLCDNTTSRERVMQRLKKYFNDKLGDDIFWNFPSQENQST